MLHSSTQMIKFLSIIFNQKLLNKQKFKNLNFLWNNICYLWKLLENIDANML